MQVVLAPVLSDPGPPVDAPEQTAAVVERLNAVIEGRGDAELMWVASLVERWLSVTGVEIPELATVIDRRTEVERRIESLRGSGIDADDVELMLLEFDLAGAEQLALELEARRREFRRTELLASRIARLRDETQQGPVPERWLDHLEELEKKLQSGPASEVEASLQALDRELKQTRRSMDLDKLREIRAALADYRAPERVLSELDQQLETLSNDLGHGADELLERSQQRLESIISRRRRDAEQRLNNVVFELALAEDEIPRDDLDEFELRLDQATSALELGRVMEAIDLAAALLADIDARRVRRWTSSDGQDQLIEHVVRYCTQQIHFNREDILRLFVAAKTKPFVILAGLTGSGKSSIARLFAAALGANAQNRRFRRIAVRPDWIDQSEVLGMVNPLSGNFEPGWLAEVARDCERNLDQMHVVLLDEMNLAPVEHYLAEYLSALEEARSGAEATMIPLYPAGAEPNNRTEWPHALPFPRNLIVIGTVNVDETTRVLSERVLDRANVLQLSVSVSDAHHHHHGRGSVQPWYVPFQEWDLICATEPSDAHHDFLVEIGEILQRAGVGVGQRAHVELERFIANAEGVLEPELALDLGVLQRIIPKIRGFKRDLEEALTDLLDELTAKGCRRSGAVVKRWLDPQTPDDEYLDGTDARIGLLQ